MFCLASIRMRAYGILPELDRLDALRLVRNSIPAVATSTAAAAGLVCIELYKIALKLNICSGRIPSQLDSKQLESLSPALVCSSKHDAFEIRFCECRLFMLHKFKAM